MFETLLIVFLNFFLYFFNEKFAQAFNLYDNPDSFRKFHKTKVPLTGGIIILINIIFVLIFTIFDQFYYLYAIAFCDCHRSRSILVL